MLSPGSTTQETRGGGPAHKSGSRASSLPSTALNTSAPSLPTHPPRLGPRRAISGDLALSRAISGPRRAISGDLGASLARRHTCSKRKGLVGATGLDFETFGGFGDGVRRILRQAADQLSNKLSHAQHLDEATWTTKNWHGLQMQRLSVVLHTCLLYTSPSPRDRTRSRMPSSA